MSYLTAKNIYDALKLFSNEENASDATKAVGELCKNFLEERMLVWVLDEQGRKQSLRFKNKPHRYDPIFGSIDYVSAPGEIFADVNKNRELKIRAETISCSSELDAVQAMETLAEQYDYLIDGQK